ncbi:SDR family oxidoreductase [Legionella sp. 27cVA30]|uniref:SDR family oxidoreductase n=1 Tax=Legionella septentrionalis TaxID=2498109 RepID=A0A3S0V4B2_9GAMM|nr:MULTISPECIES: SDR family oxidoreductase [Legionella]MCP0913232.1 SDR family oxidoreductase [Legionella sp. 27cVA30]RUQ79161.1 SDR family oxidoreductase [Legionella septentrionalis]
MNILILGSSGFLGSWVTSRLLNRGHQVICAVRQEESARARYPNAQVFTCDFLNEQSTAAWLQRLANIDVIINCAGIFYHYDKKIMWALHYNTPKIIYEAARQARIKKIIHISALGIENYDNDYAKSKLAAEKCLHSLGIPYIILRPSFIYGPGSAGSMTVLRTISALPLLIPIPGKGEQTFQPIHVSDLSKAVVNFCEKQISASLTLAAVSSKPISLKNILLSLRQWLGLKKARLLRIPIRLINIFAVVGNYISYSVINSAAIQMLERGNRATPEQTEAFIKAAGFSPMNFNEGLNKTPAAIQDKWYARLFFMRPLLRISLAFMWLVAAMVSLLPVSVKDAYQLLGESGINSSWQSPLLYSAVMLNALIGMALLLNYRTKLICLVQIVVILVYTLIITFRLPYFWLEPFGPVVKNIPILVSIAMLYFMEKK